MKKSPKLLLVISLSMILTAFHSFPGSKTNEINNLLNPFPEQFLKEKQKCNNDNLFTVIVNNTNFIPQLKKIILIS